ncbi:MAG: hypothetical protein JWP50_3440 [Phenylobacterium sp.]|nr:hypothetical protein [Phenylobacterium sp.]
MTSKAPPIPPEQRAYPGDRPNVRGGHADRRDMITGLQSGQPGDDDVNLKEQGRHGNRRQNVDDVQHKQQDR